MFQLGVIDPESPPGKSFHNKSNKGADKFQTLVLDQKGDGRPALNKQERPGI